MKTIPGSLEQHRIALYAILFLFFIQLVTDFIEAVYAFGLLGTGIPNEIISILFFLSPLVLVILGMRLAGKGLIILAGLILVSRLIVPLLDPRGRMLVAGLGTACFLIFLPLLLWWLGDDRKSTPWRDLGLALVLSLALSVLLRAISSGSDLSMQGWGQIIAWLLAGIAAALLPGALRAGSAGAQPTLPGVRHSFGRLTGLCLGVTAVFILLHLAYSSPNVIARWTGASYLSILGTFALAMSLFSLTLALKPDWLAGLTRNAILVWNILFAGSLALTILPHQLDFPTDPSGYPFYEPPVSLLSYLPLYLMLLLSPILVVDFVLYTREIILLRPALRRLGGGFSIASTFYLLVALAHVFTTVYAYIPLIGPFFRDRFWLVYLAAGIALALPVLLVEQPIERREMTRRPGLSVLLLGVYVAALGACLLVSYRPLPGAAPESAIRLLTYNIQQGYSADGWKNFDGQLDLIRRADPDILGLQESDTNRIAGGNADLVRYFADLLGMHAYYGPKTTTGTFGIALLSRYPIQEARTLYMYSQGEQTAAISARIRQGEKSLNIFVTHLGNGGPIVQQEALLKEINGLENVIAMGDFNFRPESEQYRLTTGVLDDAWLLAWPGGVDDQGFDPVERIDHVFVSPGTDVLNARFITGPESDHPALLVDIAQ